ncbi:MULTISPECIES: uroporphyrinogen-III C-methyltransferase [Niastella]|uniref:uroporphyrinogen-III C-methyltransferase n=1 Tax=Niastella soli TaxID=2821487 RepID=A0ABS3YLQ1_9BACT|nr:uroporphyrinogen-III C-methyltransferase [Niastella soli]MBO9198810.1 uroporphyrinogen-III C-methyltransferase [Niastella soli]
METVTIEPELIVAGAGAGDPELITLKAYKHLQEVPVVLYDNLVNKSLLNYTSPHCETIYVGKLPYGDYTPQEQIHELIKEKAFSKGRVLRLKGGDPFIFGRGFEEILFARQHGIKTTYIPGITSMQASGLYDIPLTFRNISESIWVVTGTKKDGSLSADLQLAIQSKATVVIYMGMKKLPEIASIYIDKGYADMPAAIIHYASLPYHKLVKGKIKDLPQLAAAQQITHPALIIIGPVTDTEFLSATQ